MSRSESIKEKSKIAYKVVYKDERDFWNTIGVAFNTTAKGKPALSLKLNLIPTSWDGGALLVEPQEKDDQ